MILHIALGIVLAVIILWALPFIVGALGIALIIALIVALALGAAGAIYAIAGSIEVPLWLNALALGISLAVAASYLWRKRSERERTQIDKRRHSLGYGDGASGPGTKDW